MMITIVLARFRTITKRERKAVMRFGKIELTMDCPSSTSWIPISKGS